MGLIRGRADARGNPGAVAYYDRLERESELVFRISPYRQDSEPQEFSFDLSYSLLLARLRAARPGRPGPPPRRLHAGLRRVTRRSTAIWLGGILLAALALRLWNLDHGLPFAYNADEAEHFVPQALDIAGGGGPRPRLLREPAGAHVPARARLLDRRDRGRVPHRPRRRRADRHARRRRSPSSRGSAPSTRARACVAAALMAVAFLPVFYSKHALNDVVTLAPVTIGLIGALLVYAAGPLGRLRCSAARRSARRPR